MADVGLIGFGLLGAAFATRLQAARVPVRGFDVDPTRRDEMARQGVAAAPSLDDLATASSTLVVTVYSAPQVDDVLGALAAASAGSPRDLTMICCTTVDPESAARLAERAEAASIAFLEFPVSGTSAQVSQGLGLGLCAGPEDLVAVHRNLLAMLTPQILHLGAIGAAARTKLAINLVLEVNRTALAEGMFLAERLGLDAAMFEQALRASAAYSRVMDGKIAKLRTGDFTPEGRIAQSLKDLELMQSEAARHGASLPMAQRQAELLAACVAAGDGDLDAAAVIRELRRRSA